MENGRPQVMLSVSGLSCLRNRGFFRMGVKSVNKKRRPIGLLFSLRNELWISASSIADVAWPFGGQPCVALLCVDLV